MDVSEFIGDDGLPGMEVKKYREFPMNIERDQDGELMQTREEKFFEVRPEDLAWEGKISITGQSIVPESPLLEKQNILEMSNIIIPLLMQPYEVVGKAATQILKQYDQDPEDWFPDMWLQAIAISKLPPEQQAMIQQQQMMEQMGMMGGMPGAQAEPQAAPAKEPLFVPKGGNMAQQTQAPQAQKVVPSTNAQPTTQGSAVGKFISRLNPFKNPGK